MGTKKQTKKFQQRHLQRAIKDRKAFQKKRAVIERANKAKAARSGGRKRDPKGGEDEDEDDGDSQEAEEDTSDDDDEAAAVPAGKGGAPFKGMSVEDFLGGGFKAGMDGADDDEDDEDDDAVDDDEEDGDLSELEDLSDGEEHMQDLEKLKEKDPEFYKFLQENDRDLLNFNAGEGSDEDDEEMDSDEEDEAAAPSAAAKGKGKMTEDEELQEVVTPKLLRSWQKAMIQQRSLKALRNLLLAFRAAAHMNDPDEAESSSRNKYAIEEAAVFNKLVVTVLKYTPVVLQHHIPAKETAKGKYKLPTNDKKFSLLQRPIQIYFANLHHLLRTVTEAQTLYVAVSESTKMVPFVMNNRRMAREYVKVMLELWATGADNVRIAAFLSVRKMASAGDDAMMDLCLRGAYQSFLRSTKLTTVHTLPSINLMKNSASELYNLDLAASYQHAFSFIRQLAIHLRGAMKTKSKDSFNAIYNWQYLHCLDFWSLVLSTTCDSSNTNARHNPNDVEMMRQLIYPLVQVSLGVMRLNPTSRYFPLRLHVTRSLLRLTQRVKPLYVPLFPALLEILSSPEFLRKAKGSTLKPLDLTTTLRAPAAYVRTRIYSDQLAEEVCYLLLEFLSTQSRSLGFPELVVPLQAQLRRVLKKHNSANGSSSSKLNASLRAVLGKIDASTKWIQARRGKIDFGPANLAEVERLEGSLRDSAPVFTLSTEDVAATVDSSGKNKNNKQATATGPTAGREETPLEGAARLARKVREQKRRLVEADRHVV